jgi:crotonobetainyl-CoA:carnitine CoA-transferase CaiB-like acyl-CoA transferase
MLGRVVATEIVEGKEARGYGNRNPARPFVSLQKTRDGYVYFAPITLKMWREVTELMGKPYWCPNDGRSIQQLFADEGLRQDVEQAVTDWIAEFSSRQLVELLQSRGVACSEVRGIRTLYEDSRAETSGEVISVRLPSGGLAPAPGPSFRVAGEPDAVAEIPALGQHTVPALTQAGVALADIEALIKSGAAKG